MPADYVIDTQRRIVFTTIGGVTTAAQLMDHQRRLQSDPSFASDFNQLIDVREAKSHAVMTADLQRLAEQNLFGAGSRRAFVVATEVHYGMARMFEMMRHGPEEIAVFRDIDEARRWLGLDQSES